MSENDFESVLRSIRLDALPVPSLSGPVNTIAELRTELLRVVSEHTAVRKLPCPMGDVSRLFGRRCSVLGSPFSSVVAELVLDGLLYKEGIRGVRNEAQFLFDRPLLERIHAYVKRKLPSDADPYTFKAEYSKALYNAALASYQAVCRERRGGKYSDTD